MVLRWRPSSVFLAALIFAVFFFVLRNDRLRATSIPPAPIEGHYDNSFDEKADEELRNELTKVTETLVNAPGTGSIYTPNLKEFDTNPSIVDQIRHTDALREPVIGAPYSPVPPKAYHPQYRIQDKDHWELTHPAEFVTCDSPWRTRGISDDIRTFLGHPKGFPDPAFGNRDVLDWERYTCFDRQGRWGPYGYTEGDEVSEVKPAIQWESVNWGALQEHCLHKNVERFNLTDKGGGSAGKGLGFVSDLDHSHLERKVRRQDPSKGEIPRPDPNRVPPPPVASRTAILLRASYRTIYHKADMENIRALINELSFKTGGEYQVFLLVEARESDCEDAIWTNKALYDRVVAKTVPAEFIEIAHLYTERLLRTWYPAMPASSAISGDVLEKFSWLAIQRFANLHPSFAYYWNWDLNIRFTGHYQDLVFSLLKFAKRQPRKCLWERNERLYIPSLHGAYETAFRDKVEAESDPDAIVWEAPVIPELQQHGPRPPPELAKDEHFKWGVGEDADLISLFPIFDPTNTTWDGRNDIWGYELGASLPRRATWGTFAVVSKVLLDLMHVENIEGRFVNAQMAPPTVALLHALKAVYAPHPVWFETPWQGEDLQRFFNSGPRGEVGSGPRSSYGHSGRGSHAFWGKSSFDTESMVGAKLWDMWMGRGLDSNETETGRPCLPPMLLFPIRSHAASTEPVAWEYKSSNETEQVA